AFLGWLLSFAVLWYFQPLLQNNLGEVSQILLPVPPLIITEFLLVELLIALLVGGLGSFTAVRRYLHL
ncbi:MAG: hypothetical protein M1142_04795, partial [Patescibacteria group bacterium]|nr:hypothetical protein [Patescibacteria group bacterium]